MKKKMRLIFITVISFIVLICIGKYNSVEKSLIFSGINSADQTVMNNQTENDLQKILTNLKVKIENTWALSYGVEKKVIPSLFSDEDFNKVLMMRNDVTYSRTFEPYYYYGKAYSIKYTITLPLNYDSTLVTDLKDKSTFVEGVIQHFKELLQFNDKKKITVKISKPTEVGTNNTDYLFVNVPCYWEVKNYRSKESEYKLISTNNILFTSYMSLKHDLGKDGSSQIELLDIHNEFYYHENLMNVNMFVKMFTNKRYSSKFLIDRIILDNNESIQIKTPVKPEVNDTFID